MNLAFFTDAGMSFSAVELVEWTCSIFWIFPARRGSLPFETSHSTTAGRHRAVRMMWRPSSRSRSSHVEPIGGVRSAASVLVLGSCQLVLRGGHERAAREPAVGEPRGLGLARPGRHQRPHREGRQQQQTRG